MFDALAFGREAGGAVETIHGAVQGLVRPAKIGVTSRNGNNRTLSDSRRLGKRRVGVNPSLASGKAR